MRKRLRRLTARTAETAVALAAAGLLAACGQKGPLYLPEKAGEVVTRPAPTTEPAPAEEPKPEAERNDETTDPPR